MPDFDPKKFLAETAPAKAPFDPRKFLAETAPVPPPAPTDRGMADAAMRGVAQGATLGFADEATAAVGGLKDYIAGKMGLRGDVTLPDAYHTYRDAIRRADAQSEEQHPVIFNSGQIGGAIASSLLPGVGALNAGKGAGIIETVGKGALQGATAGAGQAANITDVPEEMARGGVVGGLGGAASKVLGGAVSATLGKLAPEALENVAERRAFKAAVGNQGKIYDDAEKLGRINTVGRDLLNSGAVEFGSKARDIAEKSTAAKSAAGSEINGILTAIDAKSPGLVNGESIADKLRAYASRIGGEGNASTVHKLHELADTYESRGALSLLEAQTEKNSFKYRPGDPGASFDKEANNAVKGIIGDEMEHAVGRFQAHAVPVQASPQVVMTGTGPVTTIPVSAGASSINAGANSGELAAYEAAKQKYGSMALASNAAEKLANRQEKNATFGLLPTLAGLGGVVAGHGNAGYALAGPALAIAMKIARERGSSAIAVGADKAAQLSSILSPYVLPAIEGLSKGNASLAAAEEFLKLNDKKRDAINRRIGH